LILFNDLETFCETPISVGSHRYAEDAEVMLWGYAIDDAPAVVWDLTEDEEMPADLAEALDNPDCRQVWHNGGMFDAVVLRHAMNIILPLDRVDDTLVIALQHGLPGSLDKLCDILRVSLDKAKSKEGKKLIKLFCQPRPKRSKLRRATKVSHPTEWAQFVDYARLDIEAMRETFKKLPKWNCTPTERDVWLLDQTINNRGMCVDVAFARAALAAVDREQATLAESTQEQTFGVVASATQRSAMLAFIQNMFGVEMPDLQGSTVERLIDDPDTDPALRMLLLTRLQSSTASVAKYKALLKSVSADGRLRGTKQYCGASRTGRWAGRIFQPDNLPRPWFPSPAIEAGIEALKDGEHDAVLHGSVMDLTSNALRGCIVAPEGKTLDVADLSNIEGRVLAWLAGEQWKLDAFAAFDRGEGEDLYKLTAGRILGKPAKDVTKDERQSVGKVSELALGYQGGVGAFLTFAMAYNLDLDDLAAKARAALPAAVLQQAGETWEWMKKTKRNTMGLEQDTWIAIDSIKRAWRNAHPAIVRLWGDLENAARTAITMNETVDVGFLTIDKKGSWLRIRLPSGRFLCYPAARVDEQGKISYMGVNQYSRRFERISTYGGKLVENVTQAVARDVLAHGMLSAEAMGYEITLSVHDEIISERTVGPRNHTLAAIMAANPPWADGLPLAAAGFEATRYRKE
jgi:DNA polymerase bacteriophage-type